jgi:ring-1,2-phenylacetyl-CoA epoxidase subunit PaaC
VHLVELPNGDFARSIVRLLVFSTWRLALLTRLVTSADPVLAAIAAKGVKEVTYHRDYAARWAVRLGDGTEYSRARMVAALEVVFPLVEELFAADPVTLPGIAVTPGELRSEVDAVLDQVLASATLVRPVVAAGEGGGRRGVHTPELTTLLGELQSVARAHPDAAW